ncbi:hypothetical protein [Spirochaeta lutea]|uniref:Uncharacterized protein n=1 Tax=Spirochaeta lutea TaxID=1480694 RepID=A0A098QUZ6_9SPIO|nr:hypothetical protein [Spirochaeta lutea]KGE71356.1 hypothetical protein DC28_11125 [Spirochaeta lutea]
MADTKILGQSTLNTSPREGWVTPRKTLPRIVAPSLSSGVSLGIFLKQRTVGQWGVSIVVLWLALVLSGCTGNPPELLQVRTDTAVMIQDGQVENWGIYLTLVVDDPDGNEDIQLVRVRYPGNDLLWEVTPESPPDKNGLLHLPLITLNPQLSTTGMAFPGGTYEVEVFDRAGDSSGQTITVPRPPGTLAMEASTMVQLTDQGLLPLQQPVPGPSLEDLQLGLLLTSAVSPSHRVIPIPAGGLLFQDYPDVPDLIQQGRGYLMATHESGILVITSIMR